MDKAQRAELLRQRFNAKSAFGYVPSGKPMRAKVEQPAKVKKCVSVKADIYERAVSRWPTPFSNLVEMLLDQFASNPIN